MRNKIIIHFVLCALFAVILGITYGCYTSCVKRALKASDECPGGIFIIGYVNDEGHVQYEYDLDNTPEGFVTTGAVYDRDTFEKIVKKKLDKCILTHQ